MIERASSHKVVAIVQARLGSLRLPGKVLRKIGTKSIIEVLLLRLSNAQLVDEIIVAVPETNQNNDLKVEVERLGFQCFQGSEMDVLERFHKAALASEAKTIVRITGDCPLVDPELVDSVVARHQEVGSSYTSNIAPPTFPDGLDVEVFSIEALSTADRFAVDAYDREHVTPYIRNASNMTSENVAGDADYSDLRWTVDNEVDLEVVKSIFAQLNGIEFSWKEALKLYQSNAAEFSMNKHLVRNEGAALSSGQKLWHRAKRVISGGNMLLSKRPEMILPDLWPTYFKRAEGCEVWDLDGRHYLDVSLMGVGTNILGYGNTVVDAAVLSAVNDGNMSTLNCPEEVYLAEEMVALHPWSDSVRFARSGGEANAIAIRIARAATGREIVAVCGYHGWHDWYLSANLDDPHQLSQHLLPGLEAQGVPSGLKGSVLPFVYNDFETLRAIAENHDLAAIKMEVQRSVAPEPGFLQKVRDLATRLGIVLIFDECTSGFRACHGGLHKKYGVEPDVAVFGKALGNGYAITAILGRNEVMEAAQSTFISSTFWTERIGSVAALSTLKEMEKINSWEVITEIGTRVQTAWKGAAMANGLDIDVRGLPALSTFTFEGDQGQTCKTLFTQSMLGKGFLASNLFYASIAHDDEVLEQYFEALHEVFGQIARLEQTGKLESELKGEIAHLGFSRLN